MTHGCQVVYFIGLNLLNDFREIHGIGHISVMENQVSVFRKRILIKMVNSFGIKH